MNPKKELEEIRNERNNLKEKNDKIQKRKVEVIEFEDGTYSLIGFSGTWNLPLQKNEIKDAFGNWVDGAFDKGIDMEIKLD